MKTMKNIKAFDGFVMKESNTGVNPQRFSDNTDIWMIAVRDPAQRDRGYDARQIEIVGFYEDGETAYSAFVDLTKRDFNQYVDEWRQASFGNITNAPWAVLERHINEWQNLYELQFVDVNIPRVLERIRRIVDTMMKDPQKVQRARDIMATAVLLGFDVERVMSYSDLSKMFDGDMSWAGTTGKRMRGGEMFGV